MSFMLSTRVVRRYWKRKSAKKKLPPFIYRSPTSPDESDCLFTIGQHEDFTDQPYICLPEESATRKPFGRFYLPPRPGDNWSVWLKLGCCGTSLGSPSIFWLDHLSTILGTGHLFSLREAPSPKRLYYVESCSEQVHYLASHSMVRAKEIGTATL